MPTQAPVRLLALDTSTHRMSVGVSMSVPEPGQARLWLQEAEGGAQSSATLIPTTLDLLAQAKTPLAELDALVWGHGPGAFTGLRTAAAVVQGLAYGTRPPHHPTGLPVLGIDTLLAVAEEARVQWAARTIPACPGQPLTITAVLDARMDEVYAATYTFGQADQPTATLQAGPWLLKPDELAAHLGDAARQGLLAGNAFDLLGHRLPDTALGRQPAWPTAGALLRLAPGLLAAGQAAPAAQAQPLYVRDKVAQTTEERLPRPAQPGPAPAAATA
jgi:tRNA threonylcarbamoyladenosine biosynthesis protein TsaB